MSYIRPLTAAQRDVLDYLRTFIAQNRIAPIQFVRFALGHLGANVVGDGAEMTTHRTNRSCENCGGVVPPQNGRFCSMACRTAKWIGAGHPNHSIPADLRPTYRCYNSMKNRCCNARTPDFKRYGGNGILVCDRWLSSFDNFVADMGKRPSRGHTLDRIDNSRGYEPGNVRWATRRVQRQNQSRIIEVEFRGERMDLASVARLTGTPYARLRHRVVKMKMPIADAIGHSGRLPHSESTKQKLSCAAQSRREKSVRA